VTGTRDRKSPTDFGAAARQGEYDFESSSSDIRPLVPLRAIPWLVMTLDQVKSLPLDPRAGLIISLIDGDCTIEMILDMSGIPENEALEILGTRLELRVIVLRDDV
jgi:hypothetical protein